MRVWAMAQTVCIILDATERARLNAIIGDRSRPLKHIQRARILLLSAERLSLQQVARQAGVSRPAVWRGSNAMARRAARACCARRHGRRARQRIRHDNTARPRAGANICST